MNKKLIPYFLGKKIGGKLLLSNKTEFDRYSDTIKDGVEFKMSVEEVKYIRSPGANNFWHGVFCVIVAEDTGDSVDEVCKSIKRMLGRPYYWREKDFLGQTRERFWSTADMKSGELAGLQEMAKIEFAKRGFDYKWPMPEEVIYK